MRHNVVGLLAIVAIASGATSCKRHKPPALDRVWLGRYHGCALERNGGLSCWGKNDAGQLADGSKQDRRFATRTTSRDRPDALAIGLHHTCGLFGGAVRCWGVEPPKELPETGLFKAIAAAGDETCLLNAGGGWCWQSGRSFPVPLQPKWLKEARMLVGGPSFFCAAFDAPRVVRCNGGGSWSLSATASWESDRPDLLANMDVVSLATGYEHACASLADGSVMCWGDNDEGQIGDGTRVRALKPVQVVGLSGVASVHAGNKHTCARLRSGTVACWGDNHHYQLANGTTDSSTTPVAMYGLVGVQELAIGGDSACARLTDGMVKCWGANEVGQLGDGSTFDNSVPMPIKWNAADGAKR